jgi:GNAT superfamily N-acetyltransferase
MADPLLPVMVESLRAFQRGFGRAARDGEVIELPGVVACVTPALGFRSIVNAAVHDGADALREALPELEARYDARGVTAWGVWVHESDTAARDALTEHGLRLDSRPTAMAREIEESIAGEPAEGIACERSDDIDAFDAAFAAAYEIPSGAFAYSLPRLAGEYNLYLARAAGSPEAGCCVATLHHGGDCGVTLVGTAPDARRTGLATVAMRFALAEAARDGCRTTTLQATRAGRPLYERLGYREFGAMQLWEKRTA